VNGDFGKKSDFNIINLRFEWVCQNKGINEERWYLLRVPFHDFRTILKTKGLATLLRTIANNASKSSSFRTSPYLYRRHINKKHAVAPSCNAEDVSLKYTVQLLLGRSLPAVLWVSIFSQAKRATEFKSHVPFLCMNSQSVGSFCLNWGRENYLAAAASAKIRSWLGNLHRFWYFKLV
jgi:hypothetical protein